MSHDQRQHLPNPVWTDLARRAGLSEGRRRVLEAVEAAPEPPTTHLIADHLGLHHNTVREHLDELEAEGFVVATPQATGKRGRPAFCYTSTAPDPNRILASYLHLLDAVATVLGSGPEAVQQARRIGRMWASKARAAGAGTLSPDQPQEESGKSAPVSSLIPELSALGFSPVVRGGGVDLRACPLVTPQRAPHPLVCVMHEEYLNAQLSHQALPGQEEQPPGAQPPQACQVRVRPLSETGCQVRASQEA